jgi:hypothetical protein
LSSEKKDCPETNDKSAEKEYQKRASFPIRPHQLSSNYHAQAGKQNKNSQIKMDANQRTERTAEGEETFSEKYGLANDLCIFNPAPIT